VGAHQGFVGSLGAGTVQAGGTSEGAEPGGDGGTGSLRASIKVIGLVGVKPNE